MQDLLILNSVMLGVGLAMDAFSVSVANGLNETKMSRKKTLGIAGIFALFQSAMPMIGWICVHTIVCYFEKFQTFIPWIALFLLLFIGGKMLLDSLRGEEEVESSRLTLTTILVQGVATSIDALSVGFTIATYELYEALICAAIIAVLTFLICVAGVLIGKKFGTRFSNQATIFGGIILIIIGIEIFITGVF